MYVIMQKYRWIFFFFNDTATTEIYTLSLHDALPILATRVTSSAKDESWSTMVLIVSASSAISPRASTVIFLDRKSTRLNSSHANISYAVFCLKKKTNSAAHP